MPVFNDVDHIEESIKSIINQEFENFKLIISDDYSTDGSKEICLKYQKKDNRIVYIRQDKNIGISKNMEFLLQQCQSKYFIWVADDDLWDKKFLQILFQKLEDNPDAVCSFCSFYNINDVGDIISDKIDYYYSGQTPKERLRKFILNPFDAFGYGLFRFDLIEGVKFPIWLWPNKKVSWNNIYPSLCYYLAIGNYAYYDKEVLFYNRVKTKNNHSIESKNKIKYILMLIARKINLYFYCLKMINKGDKISTAFNVSLLMLRKWVLAPIYYEILAILKK